MPQIAYGNTREKVQILAPFRIPQTRTLAAYNGKLARSIGIQNVVVVQLFDVVRIHTLCLMVLDFLCQL